MGRGSALQGPKQAMLRLVVGHLFHRYFTAVPALTDTLRDEAYRIRYDVYCRELGWEDAATFPDEMERDEYDDHSLHVLIYHRQRSAYAGTVRLVRTPADNPHKPLPFELGCEDTLYPEARELLATARHTTGEISRLAVPAHYRRRLGEKPPVGNDKSDGGHERVSGHERKTPPIAMSLYLAAACAGLDAGLDSVFALMEPRLAARLNRYGIEFRQMGDPVEHRGLRAPYQITRSALFRSIDPKALALLEVIQRDLRKASR